MRYIRIKGDEKTYSIETTLACFLLFIYGLNLFNRYFYISYAVVGICVSSLFFKHKIHASLQTLFVFVFLAGYYLLTSLINNQSRAEFVVQCAIFYCFGAISYQCAYGKQYKLFKLVAYGTAGFGLYGVISSFYSVLDSGRYLQDVWGGGRLAATQVAAWCMVYTAFVPWLVFKGRNIGKLLKVLLYVLVVFSVISFFILSSRTGLIVSVFIVFLILLISIREKQSKILTAIVALFFVALLAYAFNIAGIQTAFWNSNLIL